MSARSKATQIKSGFHRNPPAAHGWGLTVRAARAIAPPAPIQATYRADRAIALACALVASSGLCYQTALAIVLAQLSN